MVGFHDAADVYKEWDSIIDAAVNLAPQFIERSGDMLFLCNLRLMEELIASYSFSAVRMEEDDGYVTLALNEIDLVENGQNDTDARMKLVSAILAYAEDYYADFSYWGSASNRRSHLPYVFKALFVGDCERIAESILFGSDGR